MTKMMMKFGIIPKLPFGQGTLPTSLQSGIGMFSAASNQTSMQDMMQLIKAVEQPSQGPTGSQPMQTGSVSENVPVKGNAVDSKFGSRTEKVLNEFLQNPLLKGEGGERDELVHTMQSTIDVYVFSLFS